MKIPNEIKGQKRLRDLDICRLYIEGLDAEEIITKRKLLVSVSAIRKVIYNNSAFINPRIAWPKTKRIRRLQKLAKKSEGILGQKTELDVLEQLRKEVEGERPLVDQSKHTHITIVVDPQAAREENFCTKLPAEQIRS